MIVVADASVALKWFLSPRPDEQDSEAALNLIEAALEGDVTFWQPPHFVAEMASVLARLKPAEALLDVRDLLQLDMGRIDDDEIYAIGTDLAVRLDHHLCDTLYHAVALSAPDAVMVTADRRYYRKASNLGKIELISNWRIA